MFCFCFVLVIHATHGEPQQHLDIAALLASHELMVLFALVLIRTIRAMAPQTQRIALKQTNNYNCI